MIDHIGIEVSNYNRAKEFYLKALAPLGYKLLMEVQGFAGFGLERGGGAIAAFWLHEGSQPSHKAHIAFNAKNRSVVDSFYEAAMRAGGVEHGKPGVREIYHPNYYGAFVLDPDGHNIEAVCHNPEKSNSTKAISPQDVLADGSDTAEFQGLIVRKGTIKAAIENAKVLHSPHASLEEKQAAKEMIQKLAPDIKALELHHVVTWNNPEIEKIFKE